MVGCHAGEVSVLREGSLKINVAGKEWVVYWSYKERPVTICVMYRVEKNLEPGRQQLTADVARLGKGDVFTKETGRKISLARVLKRLGFSREERSEVWRAYLGRGVS